MTDLLITFLASVLFWVMFGGLFVLWVIDGRIKREVALHSLISSVFSFGFGQLLKNFFQVTRPFIVNGAQALTLTTPTDPAFPSTHTAACFALATTIWLHDKRLGAVFMVGAFLVGTGRVLANVHFPADVIAGAILGIAVAVAFDRLHVFKLIGGK